MGELAAKEGAGGRKVNLLRSSGETVAKVENRWTSSKRRTKGRASVYSPPFPNTEPREAK